MEQSRVILTLSDLKILRYLNGQRQIGVFAIGTDIQTNTKLDENVVLRRLHVLAGYSFISLQRRVNSKLCRVQFHAFITPHGMKIVELFEGIGLDDNQG